METYNNGISMQKHTRSQDKESADIIFEHRKLSVNMPPYNWRELGFIENVAEADFNEYFNKDIYQILPLKYLIKILTKDTIRFMNIFKHWQDPYELFLLKQNIYVEGRSYKERLNHQCMRYYGQCWSLTKDSDAMWRIYSNHKDGVRIKTTVGKLISELEQTRGMTAVIPYFGKVKYYSKNEIEIWMQTNLNEGSGQLFDALKNSLFIKRLEFSHENEMRFVLYFDETTDSVINSGKYLCDNIYDDFIDLKINSRELIDEIAFDPRLSKGDFEDWKTMLSYLSGNIPIVQSDLYEFQPISMSLKRSPYHINL